MAFPSHGSAKTKLTTLYSFCSDDQCLAGMTPALGLVLDKHGPLRQADKRHLFAPTNEGGKYFFGSVFDLRPWPGLPALQAAWRFD